MTGIRLTLEGPPARKNAKHEVWASKGEREPGDTRPAAGRKLSEAYKAFRETMTAAWLVERNRKGVKPLTTGELAVTITAYWPTMRHLDVDVPNGDADAPAEVVLDALQYAGVIDNDARVVRLTCDKYLDRIRPRLEVWVRPVVYVGNIAPTEEELDAAISALERMRTWAESALSYDEDGGAACGVADYIEQRIAGLRARTEVP